MTLRLSLLLLVCAAGGVVLGQGQEPCPFYPGRCPVNVDNVVEVSYFDQADDYSCQKECLDNVECTFVTMFDDSFSGRKKCFLFRNCVDPSCPECVTGRIYIRI